MLPDDAEIKKGVDVMKKLLMSLLAVALLYGAVIAVRKKAPAASRTKAVEVIEIRAPGAALLAVLFDMYDPGGKVGGRMRRKIRVRLKKNPMDPELRAVAFLKMKQKEVVAAKK